MEEERDVCSKVAEFYYSQPGRREEKGTAAVVSELDMLCKQGAFEISREELIERVTARHPEIERPRDRTIRTVRWARGRGYIDEDTENWIITIKPR